jgi:hypothetical protein
MMRGYWKLYLRQPPWKRGTLAWEDLGPTPLGERGYTPQGMTWVDGRIVFANCWRDTKSRVYRYAPRGMVLEGTFDMPAEAVHTSGLAWDGRHLWAVDYVSNRCYEIDLERSFATGAAAVVGSFATGFGGTSACAMIEHDGETLLAISDYRRTSRTYVVRAAQAVADGRLGRAIVFSYRNEGFSQGLFWDGRSLLEAENKKGVDVINQLDVGRLVKTGRARAATIRQIDAPGHGVEDLAWDGAHLYTSDEKSFRFYRAAWSPALSEEAPAA